VAFQALLNACGFERDRDLALAADISNQTLSDLLNGKKRAKPSTIEAIARAMQIDSVIVERHIDEIRLQRRDYERQRVAA
jgi:hypothetical protein